MTTMIGNIHGTAVQNARPASFMPEVTNSPVSGAVKKSETTLYSGIQKIRNTIFHVTLINLSILSPRQYLPENNRTFDQDNNADGYQQIAYNSEIVGCAIRVTEYGIVEEDDLAQ